MKHSLKRLCSISEQSVKCIDNNIACLLRQEQGQRNVQPVLPRSQRTFGAEHMAHGCGEAMAYDEAGTSDRSAAVPTPKTMKQHNLGPFQPGATQRPQLEAHSQPGLRHTLVCRVLSVAVLGATSSSEYTYCCAPRCPKYSSQSSGTPLIHISDK